MKKSIESGRSMVEMIGVLAIIGVLSIMGIAGYTTASKKLKANTLFHETLKRAISISGQMMLGASTPTLDGFAPNIDYGALSFTPPAAGETQFSLGISGMSEGVCEEIKVMAEMSNAVKNTENACGSGSLTLTFNNDLSGNKTGNSENGGSTEDDNNPSANPQCEGTPSICAVGATIAGTDSQCPCTCPDHRDTTGGICGDCVSSVSWETWTQPIMTSNSTCNQSACGSLSASSVYASYHAPWYAFNGIKSGQDKYLGGNYTTSLYIVWQLPTSLKVSSCDFFQTYESYELYRFPQYITILGSNNGSDWTQIGYKTGYSLPSVGQHVSVSCDNSTAYSYLKFQMEDKDSSWMDDGRLIAVQEIEISAQAPISQSLVLNPETLRCE